MTLTSNKIYSTSNIRNLFLDYFKRNNHTIVPSSSLIPVNDCTLLFTNAGMVQFKDTFLGKETRAYKRATTIQRCVRASGKHNDLENVGYTTRHHTFFEMLGNFSFGDYFKREAINYAWNFLTNELKIPAAKLWVTVHNNDEEAAAIWLNELKVDSARFRKCGDKDNFWSMGETGPCGYCSEIFYDHGENLKGGPPGSDEEGERYVEIWNLVFMQFERDSAGKLTPLPKPSVDTGMGLERLAAVMQGTHDNYEIDIFKYFYDKFSEYLRSGDGSSVVIDEKVLNSAEGKIAKRVIADHIRSTVFLIADGVIPSNEREGYVLRSIIRRAVYYLYRLGINNPVFYKFVSPLIDIMGGFYSELNLETEERRNLIAQIIKQEEIKFLDTLERGVKILESEIKSLKQAIIPGAVVFNLHDTFGFPAILTEEIARQRNLEIDHDGFAAAMEKQKQMSRSASKFVCDELKLDIEGGCVTEFVGYEKESCNSKIIGIFKLNGEKITHLNVGEEGIVILDKTPFYAESGGQIGDRGEFYLNEDASFVVNDTQKNGSLYLHYGSMQKGTLAVQAIINAQIDTTYRQAIRLNHSATHLLHRSLRNVLGEHATQRGSSVDSKRLRFDFVHFNAVTTEEIREIELLVNRQIRADLEVNTAVKSLAAAKKEGVTALFGEKYGDEVRVVTMDKFSQELCGGTHVKRTGEIGVFKIIAEGGVAAGVRRIEAVTGENALLWIDSQQDELNNAAALLKTNCADIITKLQQLLEENRALEKECSALRETSTVNKSKFLIGQAVVVNGVKVVASKLPNVDINALRQAVDILKQQLQTAIIVLATVNDNKIQLVAGVTKDLTAKFPANELLKYIAAQIGGSGGGRPDMAQGGGTRPEVLDAALQSVSTWVQKSDGNN